MTKKYVLTGVLIVLALYGLVTGIRLARGMPPAVEPEPIKTKGPQSASLFLVEFSDFQCPYCAGIQPTLKEVLEAFPQDLKLIYKHYPLNFHDQAQIASEASECAADQGKFWEYHDLIYENQRGWSGQADATPKAIEQFKKFAKKLDLDKDRFNQCLDTGMKKDAVLKNKKEAEKLYVGGTPTLLLNGRKILTSHKPEDIKALIRSELARRGG
jgi:protein-disulfide isomerase